MSNVFYAWELGANLGHMGAFLPLARLLRERGHSVHWVLAKTHEAAAVLGPHGFSWMQAPTTHDHMPGHTPENYSSILLHHGYGNAQTLLGLVEAWRSLMRLSQADVVVVDHAPTAILAARTLGIPVMNHGNGFTVPPPVHPTPQFRSWQSVPSEVLLANDAGALASINALLGAFRCAPLSRLADLFDIAEPALMTFPELDHYGHRGPARYWGAATAAAGEAPVWPSAHGPRVFAYVRASGKHYAAVLEALGGLEAGVLVVAPGLSPAERERWQRPHVTIASTPVHLQQAAREADLGVMWGGGGNSALVFLLAGTPLVLLPNQLEPFLQGLRVQEMGAGVVVDLDAGSVALLALLQGALSDRSLTAGAQAFATRHAQVSDAQRLHAMATRLESLTPAR
ncbi:UDP-glucuronosyltransferase [Hydrogenophaga sp.]|uniref:UDP-glucuronosyltransferase n=1 Tax=Hydrogenophaga sp. TaxID=1904254 RepID=UPI0035B06672